jgi:hypothetical protein
MLAVKPDHHKLAVDADSLLGLSLDSAVTTGLRKLRKPEQKYKRGNKYAHFEFSGPFS